MRLPDWVGKTTIHVIDTGINLGDIELRIFYIPYKGDICKDDFLKLLASVIQNGPTSVMDIFTLCSYGAFKLEPDFMNVTSLIRHDHMTSYSGVLRGVFIVPYYTTHLRSYFKKIMELREIDEIEDLPHSVAYLDDIMLYLQKLVHVYYETCIAEFRVDREIFDSKFQELMRLLEPEEEMTNIDELE